MFCINILKSFAIVRIVDGEELFYDWGGISNISQYHLFNLK